MLIKRRKIVNVQKLKELTYSIHSKEFLPAQLLGLTFTVDFGTIADVVGVFRWMG